jgi:hypothetical protein
VEYKDAYVSRKYFYAIGLEAESGRYYLTMPVSAGVIDYSEYYELSRHQYDYFLGNHEAAAAFADECRRREHDDLLFEDPPANRGSAI